MHKDNRPLFSDDFLDELAQQINEEFGGPANEQDLETPIKDNNENTL
jgi:hypothetical protein